MYTLRTIGISQRPVTSSRNHLVVDLKGGYDFGRYAFANINFGFRRLSRDLPWRRWEAQYYE